MSLSSGSLILTRIRDQSIVNIHKNKTDTMIENDSKSPYLAKSQVTLDKRSFKENIIAFKNIFNMNENKFSD